MVVDGTQDGELIDVGLVRVSSGCRDPDDVRWVGPPSGRPTIWPRSREAGPIVVVSYSGCRKINVVMMMLNLTFILKKRSVLTDLNWMSR